MVDREEAPDWECLIAAVDRAAEIVGKWRERLQDGVRIGDDGRPMWRSVAQEISGQFSQAGDLERLREAERLTSGGDASPLTDLFALWPLGMRRASRAADAEEARIGWANVEDAAATLATRLGEIRTGLVNLSRGLAAFPFSVPTGSLLEFVLKPSLSQLSSDGGGLRLGDPPVNPLSAPRLAEFDEISAQELFRSLDQKLRGILLEIPDSESGQRMKQAAIYGKVNGVRPAENRAMMDDLKTLREDRLIDSEQGPAGGYRRTVLGDRVAKLIRERDRSSERSAE